MRVDLKDLMVIKFRLFCTMTVAITILALLIVAPIADAEESGEDLFFSHCAGCHINGGNIVRRGKTLKLSALKRNGLGSQEEIARVAREGIGSMSSYKDVLGEEGDLKVASWIWEQAQNAWVHS